MVDISKDKDVFKEMSVKIDYLPTNGAMAIEMENSVKYLGEDKSLGVNAPDRFLMGFKKSADNEKYVAGIEVEFSGLRGVNMKKFEENLRREADKPWFAGRLSEVSSALEWGFADKDYVVESRKDIESLLRFETDKFIKIVRKTTHFSYVDIRTGKRIRKAVVRYTYYDKCIYRNKML